MLINMKATYLESGKPYYVAGSSINPFDVLAVSNKTKDRKLGSERLCRYRHSRGENDMRVQVMRRKISAGTRSDAGRDARDAGLALLKTCHKQNISFWHYLGHRFKVPDAPDIPHLTRLVSQLETSAAPT